MPATCVPDRPQLWTSDWFAQQGLYRLRGTDPLPGSRGVVTTKKIIGKPARGKTARTD